MSTLSITSEKSWNSMQGAVLRPKERVMKHLAEQLQKSDLASGSRLPTSRALAAQLKVSASTVQAVYRDLARQGLIRSVVGNGSFLLRLPLQPKKPSSSSTIKIGMTFGFAEEANKSEPWHLSIAGSVLSAASALSLPIAIIPLQFHPEENQDMLPFLEQATRKVDGIILRSMQGWDKVEKKLSDPSFPIVHLNPTKAMETRNFVSINLFNAGFLAGKAFLAGKRKHVVFLHGGRPELSIPTKLRCAGLFSALGNHIGHDVKIRMEVSPEMTREAGFQSAKKLFAHPADAPDAIYMVSNELSSGVLDFCVKHGIKIPQDIGLISGTGADSILGNSTIFTREHHDTKQIGRELLKMIVHRVQNAKCSVPAIYIDAHFIGGQTTLPAENAVLKIG